MKRKITIIGAGAVGSTIAYTLITKSIATEILLIDINKEKAMGEATDILQATPFLSPVVVRAGEYQDAENSDIVIITSGIARKPGQSRLELAQTNVNILKSIAPQITAVCPNAIYVIVSNPVDVLTYAFVKMTGLPSQRVIGSGTSLDTARLRTKLSDSLRISPIQIECSVFGEHGDSSFIPWSLGRIEGVSVEEYASAMTKSSSNVNFDKDAIEDYVRKSGGEIIKRKGATYYGVASAVSYICKCIYGGVASVMCVSSLLTGEYGIEDVCISIPTIISRKGIKSTLTPTLTSEEVKKLQASANAMKNVISEINFD